MAAARRSTSSRPSGAPANVLEAAGQWLTRSQKPRLEEKHVTLRLPYSRAHGYSSIYGGQLQLEASSPEFLAAMQEQFSEVVMSPQSWSDSLMLAQVDSRTRSAAALGTALARLVETDCVRFNAWLLGPGGLRVCVRQDVTHPPPHLSRMRNISAAASPAAEAGNTSPEPKAGSKRKGASKKDNVKKDAGAGKDKDSEKGGKASKDADQQGRTGRKRKPANKVAENADAGASGSGPQAQGKQRKRGGVAAGSADAEGSPAAAGTSGGSWHVKWPTREWDDPNTFRLEIQVFCRPGVFEVCGLPGSATAQSVEEGQPVRNRMLADSFGMLVNLLLSHGSGLYVGPDSDGLLNFVGDPSDPRNRRLQQQQDGADGSGASGAGGAGPSTSAGGRASRGNSPGVGASDCGGADGADRDEMGAMDLSQMLTAIEPPDDMPSSRRPHGIQAHPKHFQLQGLQWMLQREKKGDALGRSLLTLHPAWLQLVSECGTIFYIHRYSPNLVTLDFLPAPIGGTCGGFLCDEMGLGKTLQCLMLVLAHPPPSGWAVSTPPGEALPLPDDPEELTPIKTTLIVTPANLLAQWGQEIETHVAPGAIKWGIYSPGSTSGQVLQHMHEQGDAMEEEDAGGRKHRSASGAPAASGSAAAEGGEGVMTRRSSARTRAPRSTDGSFKKVLPQLWCRNPDGEVALHKCDLVLMSYEDLRRMLQSPREFFGSAGFLRHGFWRLMLDEAQLVAASSSVAGQAVSAIYRRHAWVVTGTPITSRLSEVQGLCEFLAHEPYYRTNTWRCLLQQPYEARTPAGSAVLRALLRGVMLRRSKASVEAQLTLPPCVKEDLWMELSGVERAFYDMQRRRFNQALGPLRAHAARLGGLAANTSGRFTEELRRSQMTLAPRAMAALTALRQCCCHPHIVRQEAEAAGGGEEGGAGQERLSMRQIMAKLVSQAYGQYDQAAAQWMSNRLMVAAVEDLLQQREANSSSSSLERLLPEIRDMREVVSSPDVQAQARVRKRDGSLDEALLPGLLAAAAGASNQQQQQQQQQHPDPSGAAAGVGDAQPAAASAAGSGAAGSSADGSANGSGADVGATNDDANGGVGPSTSNAGAPGGSGMALAVQAPPPAAPPALVTQVFSAAQVEAGKERRRRWMRLELDCLMLASYLARIRLEAANNVATEAALAASAASARVASATVPEQGQAGNSDAGGLGTTANGTHVTTAGDGTAVANGRPGSNGAAEATTFAPSAAAAAQDASAVEERPRKRTRRLTPASAAAAPDAIDGPSASKAAETAAAAPVAAAGSVLDPEAQAAADLAAALDSQEATAAALEAATSAAAAAAERVAELDALVSELRLQLGLMPLDLSDTAADPKELRRSKRQQQAEDEKAAKAVAAATATGDSAGPSNAPEGAGDAPAAAAGGAAAGGKRKRSAGVDDTAASSDDDDDDNDEDDHGNGGRAGARRAAGAGSGSRRSLRWRQSEHGEGPSNAAAAAAGGSSGQQDGEESSGDAQDSGEEDWSDQEDTEEDEEHRGGRRIRSTTATAAAAGSKRSRKGKAKAKGGSTSSLPAGLTMHRGVLLASATAYQAAILRGEPVLRQFHGVIARRNAAASAATAVISSAKTMADKWHGLQHLVHRQEDLGLSGAITATNGTNIVPNAPSAAATNTNTASIGGNGQQAPTGSSGLGTGGAAGAVGAADAAAVEAEVDATCPICLDVCERRTVTSCGHAFCSDCIHEIVQPSGPCPICRKTLHSADLFDSVPDAEAVNPEEEQQERAAAAAAAAAAGSANGEYGAKVSALLEQLAAMSEEDPTSKALVFSSWGRLLRLVAEALIVNGVYCVTLAGGTPDARQQALDTFLHDPKCRVLLLLMNHSGGAAGLTLTVAHHCFILDPGVNPGLEAQAAARIHRLGQIKPTRVVRLLAKDTVEKRVLELQKHRMQRGEGSGAAGGSGAGPSTSSEAAPPAAGGAAGAGGEGEQLAVHLGANELDGGVLLRFFDNV